MIGQPRNAVLPEELRVQKPWPKITSYVLGFMFSHDKQRVALIKKEKPEWQRGKLNGIGGKIEEGESPVEAMVREFREEGGVDTPPAQWLQYCIMGCPTGDDPWQVYCFTTIGDVDHLHTVTSEKITLEYTICVRPFEPKTVENLSWLVPLALDHLEDRRPLTAHVKYPA